MSTSPNPFPPIGPKDKFTPELRILVASLLSIVVILLWAKYFAPKNGGWQVKDELRAMVTFQRRNLLQPFVEVGSFDVIFCRNVAIYFDAPRRRDLFLRLAERLAPGGAIFVGSSESLLDLGPRFTPRNHCRASYYQPNSR